MELSGGGLYAIAFGLVVHAVAWFFKTPKEVGSELAKRQDNLETGHNSLKNEFIAVTTKLTVEINHLAATVQELSNTIKLGIGIPPRHVKR